MKLTLSRGFETQRRAPSFRSGVEKGRRSTFRSKKPIANHSCCNTLHPATRRGRCEIQIETPLRSVKRNRTNVGSTKDVRVHKHFVLSGLR